jgi:cation transport ATPase
MSFFLKNKENDKLWRELKSEVYQRSFVINIVLTILFLTSLYLSVIYDYFNIPSYIFIFAAPFLFVILTRFIDFTFYQRALCKRIEKQQETIDFLMQKAGLSNPSPIIKVENKEELT